MGRSRPFRRLTPAERRLWEAYPTGARVDLREGREVTLPPAARGAAPAWSGSR
ncbi:hypothetical protein ACFFHJ_40175 [Planotetraspora thailandica]|uniref:hypothetical protein n=1 Tax=Planotetraspora thailandica TaxID=487172 RepID=UPI00194FA97C|nr:hypothetical protein [Planotetraspora thailandica]